LRASQTDRTRPGQCCFPPKTSITTTTAQVYTQLSLIFMLYFQALTLLEV